MLLCNALQYGVVDLYLLYTNTLLWEELFLNVLKIREIKDI